MPLYEVAIIAKAEENGKELLVFGPKAVIAKDDKDAIFVATAIFAKDSDRDLINLDTKVLVHLFN